MLRTVLFICLWLVFVVFVDGSNLILCQSKPTKHQSKTKSSSANQISIRVNQSGSESVCLSYIIDFKDYALFISNTLISDKSIVLEKQKLLNADTLIYTALESFPKFGKLVATKFQNLKGMFCIEGLPSQQDYYLYLCKVKTSNSDTFEFVRSINFYTLARSPKFQSYQIAFEEVTDSSFSITWLNGDGQSRIVVLAVGDKIDFPENGKDYEFSPIFGNDATRVGKSYVVYDGNDSRPKISVRGLKPATKYTIAVFDYNGNGKYRNYITTPSSNNPRTIITKLPMPKIAQVERTSPETYLIKWGKVAGATTYILDVALDEAFQKRVEPFIDLDVGNLGEFELNELEKKGKYYLRIKAKGPTGESLYSPIFEFKVD